MCEIRAIVDGKEVKGWYVRVFDFHFLVPLSEHKDLSPCRYEKTGYATWNLLGAVLIPDISTAAVDTGKKDKHGKEIFGSKGEMKGGDKIQPDGREQQYDVLWSDKMLQWVATYYRFPLPTALYSWESDELEIIEEKE